MLSPFTDSPTTPQPSRLGSFRMPPAPMVFLLCLGLGLVAVAWRAKARADNARAVARTEAWARGAAVEWEFSQAVAAAEVLGALAKQSGGAIPNFQKVAAELLASHPGLASLELQPAGRVSDIAPRSGHERVIGFNVMMDSAHRPGAMATIQRGVLTVAGPLALYRGAPGIVVRMPVFQRSRNGRDSFWGFVAASLALPDVLIRTRIAELGARGYDYAFFAPATAQQKAVTLETYGRSSFQNAIQQPVRAQNVEFRLALQRRGGWVNKPKVGIECLGVLCLSGLLAWLVNQRESRGRVEDALVDLKQRLGRETGDRKQAEEKCLRAEQDNHKLRARLDTAEQAEARVSELTTLLQEAMAELRSHQGASTHSSDAPAVEAAELAPAQNKEPGGEQTIDAPVEPSAESSPANGEPFFSVEKTPAAVEQEPVAPVPSENAPALSSEPPASTAVQSLPSSADTDSPSITTFVEAPVPATSPVPELLAKASSAKAARRKKARDHNQMDLFGEPLTTDQPAAQPQANAPAPELAIEISNRPTTDVAPPSSASALAESVPPGEATEEYIDRPETASDQQPEVEPVAAAEGGRDSTPKEEKAAPARALPAPPPVNPAQLRKAMNQILPLFTGQDPGAKDCLKANRATFRSAFTPEAFVEFEQCVKSGDFSAALEHLKKAGKKHGVSV